MSSFPTTQLKDLAQITQESCYFFVNLALLSKKVEKTAETVKSSSSPIVDFELNFTVFAKLQLTRNEFGVIPNDEVAAHTLLHNPT